MSVTLSVPLQSYHNIEAIYTLEDPDFGPWIISSYTEYANSSAISKGWAVGEIEKHVTKAICYFDTSVIPTGVTLETLAIYQYGSPTRTPANYQWFGGIITDPILPFAADAAHYDEAIDDSFTPWLSAPYYTAAVYSALLPQINRAGITALKLSGAQIDTPIFGVGQAGWAVDGSYPLRLVITHTDPPAPPRKKWPFQVRVE